MQKKSELEKFRLGTSKWAIGFHLEEIQERGVMPKFSGRIFKENVIDRLANKFLRKEK